MPESDVNPRTSRRASYRAGDDLLVYTNPRVVHMHRLTDGELNTLASSDASLYLAFFGFTFGAFVSLIITVYTVELRDPNTHAVFWLMTWVSLVASTFFGIKAFLEHRNKHSIIEEIKRPSSQPE
jgi:hypothetical protein